MKQSSLLPYLKTSGTAETIHVARAVSPSAERIPLAGSSVAALYSVSKDGLPEHELSELRRELTMTPRDTGFDSLPFF